MSQPEDDIEGQWYVVFEREGQELKSHLWGFQSQIRPSTDIMAADLPTGYTVRLKGYCPWPRRDPQNMMDFIRRSKSRRQLDAGGLPIVAKRRYRGE
jgi:hypothetical protein